MKFQFYKGKTAAIIKATIPVKVSSHICAFKLITIHDWTKQTLYICIYIYIYILEYNAQVLAIEMTGRKP